MSMLFLHELAAFVLKICSRTLPAPSWQSVSMERQQF